MFIIYLFIYFWLCWVFVAARFCSSCDERGLLQLQRHLLLPSTSSRVLGFRSCGAWAQSTGSIVLAHGCNCSKACGIFLDQGSHFCLLHWLGRFFTTETYKNFQSFTLCLFLWTFIFRMSLFYDLTCIHLYYFRFYFVVLCVTDTFKC